MPLRRSGILTEGLEELGQNRWRNASSLRAGKARKQQKMKSDRKDERRAISAQTVSVTEIFKWADPAAEGTEAEVGLREGVGVTAGAEEDAETDTAGSEKAEKLEEVNGAEDEGEDELAEPAGISADVGGGGGAKTTREEIEIEPPGVNLHALLNKFLIKKKATEQ